MVGVDQAGEPATAALARLRAAAAAVVALDRPGDATPGATTSGDAATGDTTSGDAATRDTAPEVAGTDGGFDATVHADRFGELHDALVTVLADVDRG